ncbi:hypothetical protein DL764_010768 [Monosporascus ibericus]|uniref:Major facilitator superfamily (MFS) profile domain-containing protein n=1 Tax=Monosporascus ibericus TaxID=155417 RepID=A0A4Q4SUP7_9PEZI|nr:hypothetical protein DL764_010768 [Monosporascus ibericus]
MSSRKSSTRAPVAQQNERVENHNEVIGEPLDLDTNAGPQPPSRKPVGFYLAFLGLCITIFIYSLDATTLAVAIPAIAAELHGTTLLSFWASISYILAVVVTQPLYATVSDIFGRKACLYAGYLLFAAGSLLFALAPNMAAVTTGRMLQGLGGGGLNVLGEIIVTDMTTLQERSLYLGLMALPVTAGSILGPTVGALLSDFATWRWIGWVNLPLLGLAFPLVLFFLNLRALNASLLEKLKRLDWVASSLAMLSGLPILWGVGIGALLRILQLPIQASVPSVDDTSLAVGLLLSFQPLDLRQKSSYQSEKPI